MVEVKIDTSAFDRTVVGIRQITSDLRDFFTGPAENAFTAYQRRVFASEGAENGSKWAPLKPSTLKAKKRRGHGKGGIGRDTNALWASLTKRGSPGAVASMSRTEYLRGTAVNRKGFAYAGKFQDGSRNQPGRPIIPDNLPKSFTNDVENRFQKWVNLRLAKLP